MGTIQSTNQLFHKSKNSSGRAKTAVKTQKKDNAEDSMFSIFSVLSVMGLFIGRIVMFSFINPLAVAYPQMLLFKGRKYYLITFFTVLGIVTRYPLIVSRKYLLSLGVLCLINLIYSAKKNRPHGASSRSSLTAVIGSRYSDLHKATLSGSALFASSVLFAVMDKSSSFFYLLAVLEGLLTFAITFIISKCMPMMKNDKPNTGSEMVLSQDEIFCFSLIAAGFVAGSADIYIGVIALKYFLSSVILLFMAYNAGASIGSLAGMLLGVLLFAGGFCPVEYIVILSFSGFVAGMTKNLPKAITAACLIIAQAVGHYILISQSIPTEFLYSLMFAAILFILMKTKIDIRLENYASDEFNESHAIKLKEISTKKLTGIAHSFERLSKVFSVVSKKKNITAKDISSLADQVELVICAECTNRKRCWEDNIFSTHQNIYAILNNAGKSEDNQLTDDFIDTCINIDTFSDDVISIFNVHKATIAWQNKLIESKELVSMQLLGVSKIIYDLSAEINKDARFQPILEKEVRDRLRTSNAGNCGVSIMLDKNERYVASVICNECKNGRKCDEVILPAVQKVLGKRMRIINDNCSKIKTKNGTRCKIDLTEDAMYNITAAARMLPKDNNEISGDSHSILRPENGSVIMALSDGMGTGRRAQKESEATIDLLEDFIETGFDRDLSIRLINSALLLKTSDDSFSTLDICSVDLFTGIAEFVKIGASTTYIKRNNDVSAVRSFSLPIGVINSPDMEISTKKLKDGDIIIMITDGIIEHAIIDKAEDSKEGWLLEYIAACDSRNPEIIADGILEQAKEMADGCVFDDMTVIAARFWSGKLG